MAPQFKTRERMRINLRGSISASASWLLDDSSPANSARRRKSRSNTSIRALQFVIITFLALEFCIYFISSAQAIGSKRNRSNESALIYFPAHESKRLSSVSNENLKSHDVNQARGSTHTRPVTSRKLGLDDSRYSGETDAISGKNNNVDHEQTTPSTGTLTEAVTYRDDFTQDVIPTAETTPTPTQKNNDWLPLKETEFLERPPYHVLLDQGGRVKHAKTSYYQNKIPFIISNQASEGSWSDNTLTAQSYRSGKNLSPTNEHQNSDLPKQIGQFRESINTLGSDRLAHHYLPNGPPPFRPSMIMIGASSSNILQKLKKTVLFKKAYKSRLHLMYLDIIRQLTMVAKKIASNKIDQTKARLVAIQAMANKFAWKGSPPIKLKWPLVILNPHFIRELLANPTFLVMLFHAVEVAYLSMPINFWLKPLVKLVNPPGPEKEEKIWWRRKRIYDTLNGHGSSELQPNLKTIHFRKVGSPAIVAFPKIVKSIRELTGKPSPDSVYYSQPKTLDLNSQTSRQVDSRSHLKYPEMSKEFMLNSSNFYNDPSMRDYNVISAGTDPLPTEWSLDSSGNSESTSFNRPIAIDTYAPEISIKGDWLSSIPNREQLMSKQEFDSLDPKDKELISKEARRNLEESNSINELIKHHSDLVDSLRNNKGDMQLTLRPNMSPSHLTGYSLDTSMEIAPRSMQAGAAVLDKIYDNALH